MKSPMRFEKVLFSPGNLLRSCIKINIHYRNYLYYCLFIAYSILLLTAMHPESRVAELPWFDSLMCDCLVLCSNDSWLRVLSPKISSALVHASCLRRIVWEQQLTAGYIYLVQGLEFLLILNKCHGDFHSNQPEMILLPLRHVYRQDKYSVQATLGDILAWDYFWN